MKLKMIKVSPEFGKYHLHESSILNCSNYFSAADEYMDILSVDESNTA